MASPTTAYIAQGCSVQWNNVVAIAVWMASDDSASVVSGGGATKCDSGSATPKNIRPIPMPALNIIAIHEMVRNSGRSWSRPSGIRPYLPAASQITNTTNADASSTNSQPRLPVIQPRREPLTVPRPVGVTKPQTTKPSAMTAATANRTRSTAACRSAMQAGGSAMAGCVPVTDTSEAATVEAGGLSPPPPPPLAGGGAAPPPAPRAGLGGG